MFINDDEVFDPAEEECPGPADLESAVLTEILDKVTTQPLLVGLDAPIDPSDFFNRELLNLPSGPRAGFRNREGA